MDILIKCALYEDELLARKRINENNVEIQLLHEFYEETPSLEEYLDTLLGTGLNIKIIHTPLVFGDDVEIDNFWEDKNRDVFLKTCKLANMLGRKLDKNILVVVHTSMDFKQDINNVEKITLIDKILLEALNKYSNISVAIENIIPVVVNHKGFFGRNGFLNDNCLYIDYFINKYGFGDRIGTVLDICHALTTIRLMEYCKIPLSLEEFFDWNKKYIKLIHLANIGDNGYGKGNHGTGFIEGKDIDLLSDVLDLYCKYEYNCQVTIEVYEEDYTNPINYIRTKENVLEILRKR
jgi:hypothetical protein